MRLRVLWPALLSVCLTAPLALNAQREDPIQDLLNVGRRAYDDLSYHAADSIARLVLGSPGIRRSHRIQALQLAAASRFPPAELDRTADSALAALRQLIRISPSAPLPRTMTWAGLDSLLGIARRTTFGVAASAPDSNVIEGITGQMTFDVVASRPTVYILRISHLGDPGLGQLLDSLGPTERGSLHFAPVLTDPPRFRSGNYRLVIVATDPSSGEKIEMGYQGAFETPPVQNDGTAIIRDSTKLLREFTTPSRRRSILSGLLVGGFVFGSVRAFRSPAVKDAGVSPSSSASAWGIGLALTTTGISWFLDRGNRIKENVAFNVQQRKHWDDDSAKLLNRNEYYKVSYRGLVRLTAEDR